MTTFIFHNKIEKNIEMLAYITITIPKWTFRTTKPLIK